MTTPATEPPTIATKLADLTGLPECVLDACHYRWFLTVEGVVGRSREYRQASLRDALYHLFGSWLNWAKPVECGAAATLVAEAAERIPNPVPEGATA